MRLTEREIKKVISDYAKSTDNLNMLTSTQSFWYFNGVCYIKTHKKGAWFGKNASNLYMLQNYISRKTGHSIKLKIKGGDIWTRKSLLQRLLG